MWTEYNANNVETASYTYNANPEVLGGNDGGITGVIPSPHSKVVSINIQTSTGGYSSGPSGNHVQIITSGAPTWVAHNTNDTSTDSKIATAITALPAGADGATGATGPAGADSTVAGPAGADGAAGVVAPPTRVEFTATENQATKTGLTYTVGNIDCYINGVKMSGSSFTASDGVSVTFTPALSLGEEVQLIMGAAGASGSLAMDTGTSLPSVPSAGSFFYKTDDTDVYVSNGTDWELISSAIPSINAVATGGTLTTVSGYNIHTFTTSSTLNITSEGSVDYIVVAGGGAGGGGRHNSGGGGAGGMLVGSSVHMPVGSYSVIIGAGGTSVDNTYGGNGENTVFGAITTIGGGGGGSISPFIGRPGGSGGGASQAGNSGGAGTSGQGNSGGGNMHAAGGGGGGKGVAGFTGDGSSPYSDGAAGVAGGLGMESTITGSSVYYAGGGGGGQRASFNVPQGVGGNGGGGDGGVDPGNGFSGTANTGGGGGGSGGDNSSSRFGGAGGSGIVIIRYPVV